MLAVTAKTLVKDAALMHIYYSKIEKEEREREQLRYTLERILGRGTRGGDEEGAC